MLYRILAALILSLSLGLASPTHAQETSAVLDGGSMIVGYDGRACDASLEGAIRYNSTGGGDGGASDPCNPANSPSAGQICDDGSIYTGLSPDGNVEMYTTAADISTSIAWNNGNASGYVTTSQTSTTTGETNTTNLLTIDSDSGTGGTQPHQAAQVCADSAANGHSDWYLPAKDELNVLYTNYVAIGGFNAANYYWSSTEKDNSGAWEHRFSDNKTSGVAKSTLLNVRCVRKGYVAVAPPALEYCGQQSSAPTGCPTIGNVCSDGSVYAGLSPDGNVAMYTTPANGSTLPWNNGNASNGTVTNVTDINTGHANTDALTNGIIDSTGDSDSSAGLQPHQAAQYCKDLSAHGHTDWYLPARQELSVLCTNKVAIGGFVTGPPNYWASSEQAGTNARTYDFGGSCVLGSYTKNNNYRVRCVRKGSGSPAYNWINMGP